MSAATSSNSSDGSSNALATLRQNASHSPDDTAIGQARAVDGRGCTFSS